MILSLPHHIYQSFIKGMEELGLGKRYLLVSKSPLEGSPRVDNGSIQAKMGRNKRCMTSIEWVLLYIYYAWVIIMGFIIFIGNKIDHKILVLIMSWNVKGAR